MPALPPRFRSLAGEPRQRDLRLSRSFERPRDAGDTRVPVENRCFSSDVRYGEDMWKDQLRLLRSGTDGITQWNHLRSTQAFEPSLSHIDLGRANLSDVDFTGIDLARARFIRASLFGARFDGAILAGADFKEADLQHASFVGADLRGAKLRHAVLCHANFEQTSLESADLAGAQADTTTKWPKDFNPGSRGVIEWPD